MSSSTTLGEGKEKQHESRNKLASSRPTTPLRPTSRASLREGLAHPNGSQFGSSSQFPLDALEPAFAELSDSMADLEANLMHIQLMHESLARFNENFASFLYGLNMNAFCVDFPEAPIRESYKRYQQPEGKSGGLPEPERLRHGLDSEASIMTTDTSVLDRAATKSPGPGHQPKATQPANRGTRGASSRGTQASGPGTRGSGLARPKGRYTK